MPIAIATGGNRAQVEKSLRAVDMLEGEEVGDRSVGAKSACASQSMVAASAEDKVIMPHTTTCVLSVCDLRRVHHNLQASSMPL